MGFNILMPILIGTSLSIVLAAQIGPKVVETIKVNKIESKVIDTQDAIFESTKRYITMMQKTPTNINELIDSGFLSGKYNDNGFGGNFEISIDEIKGILNVYTSIVDERAQAIFLNSMKNKFIPKKEGLNNFVTSFVIPMDVLHGNGLFMAGVPTQKTAPDSTKHRYWYDTSNGEAILKMFDGENWVMVKGNGSGGGGSYEAPKYEDITKDFTPANQGDKKYAYDSTTNTIHEFIYHNNQWVVNYPKNEKLEPPYYEDSGYKATPIDYTVLNGHKYKKDNDGNLVLATVNCLGIPSGQTVKVEGVDYLVVDGGSGKYGIYNATNKARANTLCTSNVTDMSSLFYGTTFNLDISKWDTKRVTSMKQMFRYANSFNQNIEDWDVRSVQNVFYMFDYATSFNQPLNNWNLSSVKNMDYMFQGATSFNQPLNNWNVSSVNSMNYMFNSATSFNQPLNNWNVSSVNSMNYMFNSATSFNQPLNNWNVSSVNSMIYMFSNATSFNQPLYNWNVSNVTSMLGMFQNATSFNQYLSTWDTSNVIAFGYSLYYDNFEGGMFTGATSFNNGDNIGQSTRPLTWNTSKAKGMGYMFSNATSFNQNINSWDTSNVEGMPGMFYNAVLFNQPLNDWNVSKVYNFGFKVWAYSRYRIEKGMFEGATSFNQPLNNWIINTTSYVYMSYMFNNASSFNQDISSWNVSKVNNRVDFDTGAGSWQNEYKPIFP